MRERLVRTLLSTPHARPASGQREVAVRCPFCGDSVKSDNPHLYIGVTDNVFKYDCKRCPAQGFLTPDVLKRLGIFDADIIGFIKENMPKSGVRKVLSDDGTLETQTIIKTDFKVDPTDDWKIQYLIDRTTVDFRDPHNRDTYRVIPNFEQFLIGNNIAFNAQERNVDVVGISKNCIGFLSHDNKSINFRTISGKTGTLRYFVVSLDDKRRPYFYTPKTNFDPLAETPKFVTTEGPIGLIVVRNQYYTNDLTDVVYGASGSIGNLRQAFGRLTKLTCWLGASTVHYSDPEIPLSKYQEEIFSSYKGINRFSIVYNKANGGQDFNDIRNGFETKVFQF